MDINAEADLNNSSHDQSIASAGGWVESLAGLLGQQSAEIVAHINRWSEELCRNIKTIETSGEQCLAFSAAGGRVSPGFQSAARSAPMTVRQMCPLCGCVAFAWCNERRTLSCAQCASTGRSRLLGLMIERSGLLKRGVSVLDLTPEPGLAPRIQPLASKYRRPGPREGAEPAQIDSAELCARPPCDSLRAQFDLLIHTDLVQPDLRAVGSMLRNLSACLKDTGYMLFTLPTRVAPDATEGFDGNEVQHLLRSQFGNRLSIVDPADYLTPQDFEFYRLPAPVGLSSHTIFAISGS